MSNFADAVGWVPALFIPAATFIQLLAIFRNKSARNVSVLTWTLFGIANVCLYIYTEKYLHWQSLLGLLGTAALDFLIAGLALAGYHREV